MRWSRDSRRVGQPLVVSSAGIFPYVRRAPEAALQKILSITMILVPETKPFRLTESVKAAG
jgi:hypothetical protein